MSVEQIRFGDNDTLAALVACLIDADLMVILSDIDGLYKRRTRRSILRPRSFRRGSRQPRHPGCGRGRGVRRGKRRHDRFKAARVLKGRGHSHGHLPGAARGLHRSGRCRRGGRHAVQRRPPHRDHAKLWIALGDSCTAPSSWLKGPGALVMRGKSLPFRGHSLRGGATRVG